MGRHISSTEQFERALDDARSTLSDARDTYSQLEETATIPEWVIQALGDLEGELEELDQQLEVTESDLALAEQTANRIEILDGVLDAYRQRQRTVATADVDRVREILSSLAEPVREHDLDLDVEELERKCSMLEKLLDNGRYAQVLGNERFSPTTLADAISDLDSELAGAVPVSTRARAHVDVVESLLDEIHDYLSELGDRNDDRTAYGGDLKAIKSKVSKTKEKLEQEEPTDLDESSRVLLDECITVHYLASRATADQRLANALAGTVRDGQLDVDCDVESCVNRGDWNTLVSSIEDIVASGSELSTARRLARLLAEHDGSVVRTAEATDFDVETVIENLPQLYRDGDVADITIMFDR